MGKQVGDVGAMEQGLGWYAADVDAHPTQLVSLDHCRRESELSCADGTDIPGGTATQDDYVERVGHVFPLG
jgi:hypothetical protein